MRGCPVINMLTPEVKIIKNTLPCIYLDTNILIELSRYEKGCCKNEHVDKIGGLYNALHKLMREKRILCALGNQLEEMGTSRAREDARNFLFRFTNVELKTPSQVKNMQFKAGYQAFAENAPTTTFDATGIVDRIFYVSNSLIEVHAVPLYSVEKTEELKRDKQILAAKLNDAKSSKRIADNYDAQLEVELKADFQVFLHHLEHYNDSMIGYMNMLDALGTVYSCVGFDPNNASNCDILEVVDRYNHFLLSSYHHKLPYVWISSVLFAHVMQRQNKVMQSDHLDITWASAYFAFVDYVVTDTTFCNLLNQSGLAEFYGTKVYCFKTLNELLKEF